MKILLGDFIAKVGTENLQTENWEKQSTSG